MTINVKIKKLRDNAIIPTYGSEEAGAFDLYVSEIENDSYGNQVYKFGISMEIPKGYVGLLFPRSSNCKHRFILQILLELLIQIIEEKLQQNLKQEIKKCFFYMITILKIEQLK